MSNETLERYIGQLNRLIKHHTEHSFSGEGIEYILVKRNCETIDATRKICRLMGHDYHTLIMNMDAGDGEIEITLLLQGAPDDLWYTPSRGFFIATRRDFEMYARKRERYELLDKFKSLINYAFPEGEGKYKWLMREIDKLREKEPNE